MELLDHVMATSVRRIGESDEQMTARITEQVDHMSRSWRMFTDLEMRARQRQPQTDYDAAAAAYSERG